MERDFVAGGHLQRGGDLGSALIVARFGVGEPNTCAEQEGE
jgi:hypothetical protein